MSMNWVLLMGQPPAEGQGGGSQLLPMVMMWVLIIGIFYFLMIRPQKKKQDELRNMMENLKRGDRVLTSGGLYGTVVGVKDNVAVLKIADQVKVEVAKSAITSVLEKGGDAS